MRRTGMAALVAAVFLSKAWAGEGLLPPANPLLQSWPALSAAKDTPKPKGMASPSAPAGDKSPRRAFLLSAVLPGAGEFYADATKRAIGFFSVEAVALGLYFTWKGKGDDIEQEFRSVADSLWVPSDYVSWRNTTRASRYSSITHALPCSSFVAGASNKDEVRAGLKDCSGRQTQQYYELIGKYNQFIAGWKDAVDRDGNLVQPTEIDSVESVYSITRGCDSKLDNYQECMSASVGRGKSYEDRRNDSNVYLKRASNILGLVLVNHALSAIDAARAARMHGSGKAAALEKRTRFALVLPPERRRPTMLMAYKPFY